MTETDHPGDSAPNRDDLLRLVAENIRDYAILTVDTGRRITSWSAGAEAIFGLSAEEAIGSSADRLFTPEDRANGRPLREIELAREHGWAEDERWHQRADGSRVYLSGSVHALPRDSDGREQGFIKIARDDTARRAQAEALATSEARFRAFAETLPKVLFTTDAQGGCDYTNPYFHRFTGRSAEELRGSGWTEVLHPDDKPTILEAWETARRTGEPFEVEYRFRKYDGSYRWFLGRSVPVRDGGPEAPPTHWVGTCTDIQDIVEARELKAREAEELERLVAERTAERNRVWQMSQDMFTVAGFDGYLKEINPAWSATLGFDETTLLARPFVEFIHPDDRVAAGEIVAALRAGEATRRFEDRLRTSAGEYRWIAWTAVSEGELFYAVGRDITPEKEREAELARAQEALRQSQKMEAVGQLTGGVAHDFNNLLQIVTGNLDILQRNLPEEAGRLRRAAENAMLGAQRAAVLTQRLLAFSRRQPLVPRPLDINALVAGMSELLRRTLGETIEVETVLAGGLWRVEADANQLENALINLAVNARDAMPDGGKLTVETANAHLDRAYAAHNMGAVPGQYAAICVSDTGVGMDRATLDRVFEPFFTTKEVGKGTGLGLSMVYGFVKQSGGHVQVYSELGRGTTVRIYLPRLVNPVEPEAEAEDARVPEGTGEETILVCEDDDDVRAYSVEVLRELGYRVLEAHDGASALRLLERQTGRVDLLFTDVVLPSGMTGAVLAAHARKIRPELKVLFTTGYARDAIVHHGRLDPGVELITKPFTFGDLAARVRDILDA